MPLTTCLSYGSGTNVLSECIAEQQFCRVVFGSGVHGWTARWVALDYLITFITTLADIWQENMNQLQLQNNIECDALTFV
jgi:hypothetical protein